MEKKINKRKYEGNVNIWKIIGYLSEGQFIYSPKIIANYKISNMKVSVNEGTKIPNKFHRFMQKIILGIEWEIF